MSLFSNLELTFSPEANRAFIHCSVLTAELVAKYSVSVHLSVCLSHSVVILGFGSLHSEAAGPRDLY